MVQASCCFTIPGHGTCPDSAAIRHSSSRSRRHLGSRTGAFCNTYILASQTPIHFHGIAGLSKSVLRLSGEFWIFCSFQRVLTRSAVETETPEPAIRWKGVSVGDIDEREAFLPEVCMMTSPCALRHPTMSFRLYREVIACF